MRLMNGILACLVLLTGAQETAAQSGSILYDHATRYELEIPEQMRARVEVPEERYTAMLLRFDETGSFMAQDPDQDGGSEGEEDRFARFITRISPSRRDQEVLLASYVSFDGEPSVEQIRFMGRDFRVEGVEPWAWKLAADQKEFQGYVVQKATATRDSVEVEAWFTPQIPISSGPGPYHGLPGMILLVSVDRGKEIYSAREITLNADSTDPIEPPEDGQKLSREEYEAIVEEKLAELDAQYRQFRQRFRGRRPGGS